MSELPELPGVEHRFIDVDSLVMHVAQAGPAGGRPLLLLHGWPQNWWAYRYVIPALAAHGFQVYAPDLRGWGWTEAPRDGYDKATMTADVVALLNALQLDQVGLIGHDWGSIIGFRLCSQHGERISKFLSLGGAHLWPLIDPLILRGVPKFWYQGVNSIPVLGSLAIRQQAFIRLLYKTWAAPGFEFSDDDLHVLTDQFHEPARAAASSAVYRSWLTRELHELLLRRFPATRTQTVFLHGVADGCIDPALVRLPAALQDVVKLELLPGVGHFVAEEAPEIVIDHALTLF